jgi:hypothetical protein
MSERRKAERFGERYLLLRRFVSGPLPSVRDSILLPTTPHESIDIHLVSELPRNYDFFEGPLKQLQVWPNRNSLPRYAPIQVELGGVARAFNVDSQIEYAPLPSKILVRCCWKMVHVVKDRVISQNCCLRVELSARR